MCDKVLKSKRGLSLHMRATHMAAYVAQLLSAEATEIPRTFIEKIIRKSELIEIGIARLIEELMVEREQPFPCPPDIVRAGRME